MFNKKSEYAQNKREKDSIIYISVNGRIRLTRADFSSEGEFLRWKQWSDEDYYETGKKFFTILLSVALVIGLIPLANVQTSTKAAEKFAITTPYYNALVAAGYFDIKWNGTTEKNVKNYSVYLDGEKIGTTQSTSMDCYTTKVAMHTAYVEAV